MTDKELSAKLLKLVGGENNVKSFTNCITRLRFTLKDNNQADINQLKALDGIMGVQTQGGQLQIIVGGKVERLAAELRGMININNSKDDEDKGEKKGVLNTILDVLSGILIPSLPPIIGGGMIKGFLFLFWELGWVGWGSPVFDLLNIISDAMFYFYPFLLAVSAAKKFKTNEHMALSVAGALMHPTIFKGITSGAKYLSVFGILNIPYINYSSSVIPIILSVLLLSVVYKFFQKRIPDMLSVIFTPMLSLLIVIPISLIALAPLGYYAGEGLAHCAQAIIDFSPVVAGFVLGALRPFMVLTGTHHAIRAIISQQIATYGYSTISAVNYMSTMAQAAAPLGVYLIVRDKKMKNLAFSAAVSGFLGITEPALYSVIIKYKYVFFATAVGSGVGGAISAFFGAAVYAIVMPSILTIPATFGDGFTGIAIGLPASIIITITMIWFGRDKINKATEDMNAEMLEVKENNEQALYEIASPVDGKIMPIESLSDKTFATEVLGRSVSIAAAEGKVYAPFDGEVVSLFRTNHAVGLVSSDGVELLIHIGIDTVKLEGKYFTPKVKMGNTLKKGDLVIEFDKEAIEKEGYNSCIIIAVTNTGEYADVFTTKSEGAVSLKEPLIKVLA